MKMPKADAFVPSVSLKGPSNLHSKLKTLLAATVLVKGGTFISLSVIKCHSYVDCVSGKKSHPRVRIWIAVL